MNTLFRYLALVVALPVFGAQLNVQLRSEKDTFLVYEALPVTVTIHNYSSRPVRLEDSDDKSWLSFVVTDSDNGLVPRLAQPDTRQVLVIGPSQSVSRTIDLLPLFELRGNGSYRVQALVNEAGSNALRISLTNGRELSSQIVGLPMPDGAAEEYRTYALLARRGEREDSLYISVRDDPRQVVYSLVALGGFLSSAKPQTMVDRSGHLHVLFQNGPRSYGYVAVDETAKVLARGAYSDFSSRPRLGLQDGAVRVSGGEQVYPQPEPSMVEDDSAEIPPATKKSKRHWWWPFGARS